MLSPYEDYAPEEILRYGKRYRPVRIRTMVMEDLLLLGLVSILYIQLLIEDCFSKYRKG